MLTQKILNDLIEDFFEYFSNFGSDSSTQSLYTPNPDSHSVNIFTLRRNIVQQKGSLITAPKPLL
jgi:hypothetical protein